MKKSKVIAFLLLFVLMFIFYKNICYAYNLELVLSSDKTDVKVGDTVNITLTLSKGMQAADFTINYDGSLLEFNSASIGNNFYNANEPGKIVCSWFDTNDTKEFKFTFSAKREGIASFSTTTENFYDGDLNAASSYNEGLLNVRLLSSSSNNYNIQNDQITYQNTNNNSNENSNIVTIQSSNNAKQIENVSSVVQENSKIDNTVVTSGSVNFAKTSEKLPQTGDNSFLIILACVLFLGIAIFAKGRFNALKDI